MMWPRMARPPSTFASLLPSTERVRPTDGMISTAFAIDTPMTRALNKKNPPTRQRGRILVLYWVCMTLLLHHGSNRNPRPLWAWARGDVMRGSKRCAACAPPHDSRANVRRSRVVANAFDHSRWLRRCDRSDISKTLLDVPFLQTLPARGTRYR